MHIHIHQHHDQAYNHDHIATTRSGLLENTHTIHAAITSSTGTLLYTTGNPTRLTLSRSAAKPAQALAILETGAFDSGTFSDVDLALICGSHSAEERHVRRALRMLDAIGKTEGDLVCGGHPALDEGVNRGWIERGSVPGPACNNCSGKHAGMLAGARALGVQSEGYHLPAHPVQEGVRRVVEELSGLEGEEVRWGVDGCNLPAPAMPLSALARVYARLAAGADAGESGRRASAREGNLARIFHAMSQYPEMVAGEGRFCTVLMQAFQGMLVGKVGADGCYGVAVRASEQTKRLGAEGAIGIAVKVEDGNMNIVYAAVAEILDQLGIGTKEMRQKLERFWHPKLVNTADIVIGEFSHRFRVRPV